MLNILIAIGISLLQPSSAQNGGGRWHMYVNIRVYFMLYMNSSILILMTELATHHTDTI